MTEQHGETVADWVDPDAAEQTNPHAGDAYVDPGGHQALQDRERQELDALAEAQLDRLDQAAERFQDLVPHATLPQLYMGFLSPGRVSLLAAESNAGKSALCVWLAGHWMASRTFLLASGEAAQSMFPYMNPDAALHRLRPPTQGAVLYLAADDAEADVALKVQRFREHGGTAMAVPEPSRFAAEASRFQVLARDAGPEAMRPFQLDRPGAADRMTRLAEHVKARVCPESPDSVQLLVIIDTWQRFTKGSELSNAYLTDAVERLEEVARSTGAAILVTHHVAQPDHGKRIADVNPLTYGRGATGLAAAASSVGALVREPGTAGRVLGFKGIGNAIGPIGPVYFETHDEGGHGIQHLRWIGEADAEAIRRAADQGGPGPLALAVALLHREEDAGTAQTFTLTQVRSALADLVGLRPRTRSVERQADRLLEELEAEGWADVDAQHGQGKRRVELTDTGRQAARHHRDGV